MPCADFARVRLRTASWLVVAAVCLAAGPAAAQTTSSQPRPTPAGGQAPRAQQPQQPYRGLFGAGSPARPGGHALDLTLSVYQEYGTNVDDETPDAEGVLGSGWFTGVRGGLSFERAGQHASFGLRSDGWFRYYQESRETTQPRVRVAMALTGREGTERDTAWHLGGSWALEPYYVLPLFEADAPVTGGTAILPTGRDDLQYENRRQIFGQSLSIDHPISSRWTVGIFEDVRVTQAEDPVYDVRTLVAGARLGRRFTRYAALRLGYAYQLGEYGAETNRRLDTQDIQVSLDYRRPLPRLRRTTFGIETGSSRVTTAGVPRWEVVGNAHLRHEFDAGWFIRTDFARGVRLVEGFQDPLLQNTVSGSLGGFLGRRVELMAAGGYSRGDVGAAVEPYEAVQASARMRLALARFMAVDVEGLTYRHTVAGSMTAPGTLPASVNRWSIRCNVSVWLPLSR